MSSNTCSALTTSTATNGVSIAFITSWQVSEFWFQPERLDFGCMYGKYDALEKVSKSVELLFHSPRRICRRTNLMARNERLLMDAFVITRWVPRARSGHRPAPARTSPASNGILQPLRSPPWTRSTSSGSSTVLLNCSATTRPCLLPLRASFCSTSF